MTDVFTSLHGSASLEVQTCPMCGIVFAAPDWYLQERRNNGGKYHCPNGHVLGYTETEVARLTRALEAKKRREEILEAEKARLTETVEHERRRVSAARGQTTKLRNRFKSGLCPCCEATFPDLQTHMQEAHPEFKDEAEDANDD